MNDECYVCQRQMETHESRMPVDLADGSTVWLCQPCRAAGALWAAQQALAARQLSELSPGGGQPAPEPPLEDVVQWVPGRKFL